MDLVADADCELTRELIDWACENLADPPPGWEASVEEDQLIVVYTHRASHWRKYPDYGELIPMGTHWMCLACSFPKRWGATRCWWCDQERGILDADYDWLYGYGFRFDALRRPLADPHRPLVPPPPPPPPPPLPLPDDPPPHPLDDGDDFARDMGLGS